MCWLRRQGGGTQTGASKSYGNDVDCTQRYLLVLSGLLCLLQSARASRMLPTGAAAGKKAHRTRQRTMAKNMTDDRKPTSSKASTDIACSQPTRSSRENRAAPDAADTRHGADRTARASVPGPRPRCAAAAAATIAASAAASGAAKYDSNVRERGGRPAWRPLLPGHARQPAANRTSVVLRAVCDTTTNQSPDIKAEQCKTSGRCGCH